MLNGDGNKNSNKNVLISEKQQLCMCTTLFCTFPCHCFAGLQCRFAQLKRETS